MMKKLFLLITIFAISLAFSQEEKIPPKKTNSKLEKINSRKGQFFLSWGWNRSSYGKSDIHFKGEEYDFTLYDVKAQDKSNPFGIKFFSPADLTLPATNAKIGYFFKDNYNVILGLDHLKYVMSSFQDVRINGQINIGDYDITNIENITTTYNYDGNYVNDTIFLDKEFLLFEHTDGLNYIYVAINRFDNFNKLLGIQTNKFEVNLEAGLDIGMLLPKTNTTILGKKRYDNFHMSGFGFSAKVGLNLTFFKHFYIQTDFKYGYINMPKIRITNNKVDSAKQDFTFFEAAYTFGYRFTIW